MGVGHYENFPVGSLLLPSKLRVPVHAIYRFARSADDIADEGDDNADVRLEKLAELADDLNRIQAKETPCAKIMQQLLNAAIIPYSLELTTFHDLLSAFRQDVIKTRYTSFAEVIDYCRRSANPIGRLMLALYKADSAENIAMSDNICSALQLINFWQDVAIDWQKNRVYLPQDDLARFRVSEQQIADCVCNEAWKNLIAFQIKRTRNMLHSGAPLGTRLPGRIGLELRSIIIGGERILQKIEQCAGDVFYQRPKLEISDWWYILWHALYAKSFFSQGSK